MFSKILVPLDGSLLAESVLPHAIAVARATGARVILLHVMEANRRERDVTPDVLAWQLRKAEAQSYLDEVAQRLQQSGIEAQRVVREGRPARQIVRYLHEEACDLIVLASHGQGGLERWNLSGVAQKVIQVARTSFLLVRAYHAVSRRPRTGYQRILLALDGSPRAELALAPAAAIASYWDAELLLAHVVVQPQLFATGPVSAEDEALSRAIVKRNLEEATKYLRQVQSHLTVRSQIRLDVGENILGALRKIAEEDEVDLMICTAHGQGCNREQLYGGLVNTCLSYGCVDMLVLQDLEPGDITLRHAEQTARVWEDEAPRRFLVQTR